MFVFFCKFKRWESNIQEPFGLFNNSEMNDLKGVLEAGGL